MADIKSKLILDNTQFNKKAKASKAIIGGLAGGLSAVGGAAKGAAIAFTALTGVIAVTVATSTSYIDRLGKTASKLGIGVEFLQKFRFAAEQSGVSIETADMALQRFSRRLGEAQKGTGELLPALKQLGITQKDIAGLEAEEAFLLFADAIAKVKGESNKLSLVFKAFDSEGVSLINLIGEGSDAFLKFAQTAEGMGFILSQDAVNGVEDFADELGKLKTMLAGVVNQVIAKLAPAMEILVVQFQEFIKEIADSEDGFEGLAKTIANTLVNAFDSFLAGLEKVLNFMAELGNSIVILGRAIPGLDLFPMDDDSAEKYKKIKDSIDDLQVSFRRTRFDSTGLIPGQDVAAEAIENLKNVGFEVSALQSMYDNLSTLDRLSAGIADTDALKAFNEALRSSLELALEVTPEQLNEFLPFGELNFDSIRSDLKDAVAGAFVEGTTEGTTNPKTEQEILSFWERLAQKFADVTSSSVTTLKQKIEAAGIGDFGKTLEDGLLKSITMFEDSLANAIVQGKADFSSLGDHIRQVLAKAMVQKFISNPIMKLFGLTGLASGGPAKAGQPYIVGEEGPELFIPKNSGTVIPNDQTQAMAGGAGMGMGGGQVTYNINAVDARSFKQLVASDPEYLYNVTQVGARRQPR